MFTSDCKGKFRMGKNDISFVAMICVHLSSGLMARVFLVFGVMFVWVTACLLAKVPDLSALMSLWISGPIKQHKWSSKRRLFLCSYHNLLENSKSLYRRLYSSSHLYTIECEKCVAVFKKWSNNESESLVKW